MIAPIRLDDPETTETRRMRQARHLVASSLLAERRESVVDAPPVPRARAWLFSAWVVVVTVVYFAHLAGLL